MELFKPIVVDNEVILYDIFIDDRWYGSRRTIEQAKEHVAFLKSRFGVSGSTSLCGGEGSGS